MNMIGKIKENAGGDYPSILNVISNTPMPNKNKIVSYLRKGEIIAVTTQYVIDAVTGDKVDRELLCYSDGVYMWRSDTLYHVEKYNMQLPDEFINHILHSA